MARLRRAAFTLGRAAKNDAQRRVARQLDAMIEAFALQDFDFLSYELLSRVYSDEIDFSHEERSEVLRLAGEFGTLLSDRLGLGHDFISGHSPEKGRGLPFRMARSNQQSCGTFSENGTCC